MHKSTREIIAKRQLTSVMNRTKWLKLGDVVESFGDLEPSVNYERFDEESTGGFSTIHWDQFAVISERILWLDIQPYKSERLGALVKNRRIDIRSQLLRKLKNQSIPHSLEGENIRVWGYITPEQVVDFV